MKRKLFKSLMIVAGTLGLNFSASAAVQTITVSDFMFSPFSTTINLGDSVKFVWGGGSHTTTSTGIPSGATPWDSPMTNSVTEFYYKPAVAGHYDYVCTPHLGMGMIGSFEVMPITGVSNVAANDRFSFGPNPASSDLVIKGNERILSVDVVDVAGRVAAHLAAIGNTGTEYRYSVADLTAGLYMARINTASGVSSLKLLIAR